MKYVKNRVIELILILLIIAIGSSPIAFGALVIIFGVITLADMIYWSKK